MQVVPVEEPPAPGLEAGDEEGVIAEQPSASEGREGGRGSVEFIGRYRDKHDDRAMPHKMRGDVRVAFGKLVDELVQNGVSSGILAIRGREFSWSAGPDDTSYQRHGFVGMESDQRENIRFVDFEGAVDDFGSGEQMAVYRATLPSGGLDPNKWAGRAPPLAPEELYTGPRSDGLLSTEDISGEYCGPPRWNATDCTMCRSLTVVPLGADVIETWHYACACFPLLWCGPNLQVAVETRKPGTNDFGTKRDDVRGGWHGMTFAADGTVTTQPKPKENPDYLVRYRKRPDLLKRTFRKVDARDLAGRWCGGCCCWSCLCPPYMCLLFRCTTRTALNEDQYKESGCICEPRFHYVRGCFCLLCLPRHFKDGTHTRTYVNGHPTNMFDGTWYRDPGCAGNNGIEIMRDVVSPFYAKKLCC